eukprot:TRINITY_DN3835_c0_g1_i7.p1 TRINITY_DN3835_c0_g1~~TRINITY_DN3835_c0_g1_i7.p1  ORF type:complete len:101 (+),score=13.97 TRINITY_DN3835_c0_g1_i7:509-811(+)
MVTFFEGIFFYTVAVDRLFESFAADSLFDKVCLYQVRLRVRVRVRYLWHYYEELSTNYGFVSVYGWKRVCTDPALLAHHGVLASDPPASVLTLTRLIAKV